MSFIAVCFKDFLTNTFIQHTITNVKGEIKITSSPSLKSSMNHVVSENTLTCSSFEFRANFI